MTTGDRSKVLAISLANLVRLDRADEFLESTATPDQKAALLSRGMFGSGSNPLMLSDLPVEEQREMVIIRNAVRSSYSAAAAND